MGKSLLSHSRVHLEPLHLVGGRLPHPSQFLHPDSQAPAYGPNGQVSKIGLSYGVELHVLGEMSQNLLLRLQRELNEHTQTLEKKQIIREIDFEAAVSGKGHFT